MEIKQLKETVAILNELIIRKFELIDPKSEMWDDQDMIQNWKVSKRTLATWRKEGIIGYVQVGNKIWYPREAREAFIKKHSVNPIGGNNDE